MKKEELILKDFILKIAEEKIIISQQDYDYNIYRVWRYYAKLIERDGYIIDDNIAGLISPRLTDNGFMFLQNGGYSRYKFNKSLKIIKEMSILAAKLAIDLFF